MLEDNLHLVEEKIDERGPTCTRPSRLVLLEVLFELDFEQLLLCVILDIVVRVFFDDVSAFLNKICFHLGEDGVGVLQV